MSRILSYQFQCVQPIGYSSNYMYYLAAVAHQLVRNAHATLLPDVPLAGWDVALTNKGILLLEVNLSCNFFRGAFDQQAYFRFVAAHFKELEVLRQQQAQQGEQAASTVKAK